MIINSVLIQNKVSVFCHSEVYSAKCFTTDQTHLFTNRSINFLYGEIDSGGWAISYLISMCKYRPKDFVFFDKQHIEINDVVASYNELADYSCYLDRIHPLFSKKTTVEKTIRSSLSKANNSYSYEDVLKLFQLSKERINRPLQAVGNEIFQAMAAIGYCQGKQIFCFPWQSKKRYDYYRPHLDALFGTLESLGKTVIIPIGL